MNIGPGPVPQDVHTSLIDALHGALGHPGFDADHKAEYAGILQTLMRRQAKNHAAARPGAAGPGGAVYDSGAPTPEADTSALLARLFPPAQTLQAPAPSLAAALQGGYAAPQARLQAPANIFSVLRGGL